MGSYLAHTTSKIAALAKSGGIIRARKLFDEMPQRDIMVWNTMLTCYTHLSFYNETLLLFHQLMKGISNIKPDHYSFTATLSSCAGSCNPFYGQMVHALIVVTGYCSSLPVNNALIDMYGKCLKPCSANGVFKEIEFKNNVSWCSLLFAYVHAHQFQMAQSVFDAMPNKLNNVAWNTMIAGHARHGNIETCIDLFKKMMCDQDQWTFSSLMNASAESQQYLIGCMIHAVIVKKGWSFAVEVSNSILSFYAQLSNHPADVANMFESMETLTTVSWNAIIDAHMKIGDTQKALDTFNKSPEKNVISWTSMMTGYVRNGNSEKALAFFINMIITGLEPDDFSIGTVLHGCSIMATLGHGKMIHSFAIRYGFNRYAYVGNGLVNMYAKCGDINGSKQSFNEIIEKDLVSWNTLLIAYGLHGLGEKAINFYEEMVESGLKPDNVTFISLLMTCSHLGLINEGRAIFKLMSEIHEIVPEIDHIACMVDMLSRGGYLKEAREMANMTGGVKSSEAVFGACYAHSDVEIGTEMGGELKMLEPKYEMSYVMLSNLYCASEKWKEAELVRKAMADNGVKKVPGCSWIEVKNKVMCFVAGNSLCVHNKDLSFILYLLEYHMKDAS